MMVTSELVIIVHWSWSGLAAFKWSDVSLSVHFASYWTLTKHYIPSTHFEGTPPRPAWPPGNPMAWCLQRQAAKQGIFVGRGTQIATLTATSGYKHCRYK